jgi:competence protein ComEA
MSAIKPHQKNRSTSARPAIKWSAILRFTDQACCAGLVIFALIAMGISFVYQGGLRGRLIDVEKTEKRSLPFQLDVNHADWPEWSVLPGIGEMLAKRIVASRQADGPFRSHHELQRVRGIGPKTLERIREYLLAIEDG